MNQDGHVRFNALASSSEGSDEELNGRPTSSSEEEGEIRRKRFKVDDASMPKPDVPKWSNPDPYSVLPPIENPSGPKKDIVQVIRKAKNDIAPRPDMTQAAAKNADFISFTFDEDADNDKASTGQRDATEDHASGLSSPLSSTMSEFSASDRGWSRYRDRVAPVPLKRKNQSDASESPRPSLIDLTGDDDSPPSKRSKHLPSAGVSAGDGRSPPPPPPGFVMPTDEELMQQYIGQPKGKKRKHHEQSKAKGAITEAWEADWTNPTPWCTVDRSQTADVDQRSVYVAGIRESTSLTHNIGCMRRSRTSSISFALTNTKKPCVRMSFSEWKKLCEALVKMLGPSRSNASAPSPPACICPLRTWILSQCRQPSCDRDSGFSAGAQASYTSWWRT